LDALSLQTAPDGSRRIDWMINGMIKAHPKPKSDGTRVVAAPVSDHRALVVELDNAAS
jgi:hypothetical protein